MGLTEQLKKTALRSAFNYLEKDPETNIHKLMDWVDKLAGDGPDSFPVQRAAFRRVLDDPECNMYKLIISILKDTDQNVLKAVLFVGRLCKLPFKFHRHSAHTHGFQQVHSCLSWQNWTSCP